MTRQRMTRVVVVCVALALASPVAAQGVAVGVGAAASTFAEVRPRDVPPGGGRGGPRRRVCVARPPRVTPSLGGRRARAGLGCRDLLGVAGAGRVRVTVGDGPVRPYAQYSVGLGRRHTTTAAEALTSTVGYAGPGGGLLFTIGTTPWSLITGVDLSGPSLGGLTATEDLRVSVGFTRRLR